MFRFHTPTYIQPNRLPPAKDIKCITLPNNALLPDANALRMAVTRSWQANWIHPLHYSNMISIGLGKHHERIAERLAREQNNVTQYIAKAKTKTPRGVVSQLVYDTELLHNGSLYFLNSWIDDLSLVAVKINMGGHIVLQRHLDHREGPYRARFFPLPAGLPITNSATPISDYLDSILTKRR